MRDRSNRRLGALPEASLTPTSMIDVTFLLLVFFLCTLRFKSLDQKLEAHLPREGGVAQGEPAPVIDVRLRVLEEGVDIDNGQRVTFSEEYSEDIGVSFFIKYV